MEVRPTGVRRWDRQRLAADMARCMDFGALPGRAAAVGIPVAEGEILGNWTTPVDAIGYLRVIPSPRLRLPDPIVSPSRAPPLLVDSILRSGRRRQPRQPRFAFTQSRKCPTAVAVKWPCGEPKKSNACCA